MRMKIASEGHDGADLSEHPLFIVVLIKICRRWSLRASEVDTDVKGSRPDVKLWAVDCKKSRTGSLKR